MLLQSHRTSYVRVVLPEPVVFPEPEGLVQDLNAFKSGSAPEHPEKVLGLLFRYCQENPQLYPRHDHGRRWIQ